METRFVSKRSPDGARLAGSVTSAGRTGGGEFVADRESRVGKEPVVRGSFVPLGVFAILCGFLARIACVWGGARFFSATSDLTRTGAFDFAASERAALGYLGGGGGEMAMGTVASAGGSGATVTSDGAWPFRPRG